MYGKTNAGASTGGSNNGIEMVKLWENASPTSEFAAQTVSIDLSAYQLVEVHFKYAAAANGRAISSCPVGTRLNVVMGGSNNALAMRYANVSETGLSFESGYLNGTANTTSAIPVEIYGIKGVK